MVASLLLVVIRDALPQSRRYSNLLTNIEMKTYMVIISSTIWTIHKTGSDKEDSSNGSKSQTGSDF